MKGCILFTVVLVAVLCWLRRSEDCSLAREVTRRVGTDTGERVDLDTAERLFDE